MALRVFEETVLLHLEAFNDARWFTNNHAEAEDVVQDACVRAMRPTQVDAAPVETSIRPRCGLQ
jgi:DNA-directed RNA polymerase specialized sigma24 family protein